METPATTFRTEGGITVPAVTAAQMREVDRIAVDDFGLGVLQMMENAGRTLAEQVLALLRGARAAVTVLAGAGGNGGGGLSCARHLHNRGVPVSIALDRPAGSLSGPAQAQLRPLQAAGLRPAIEAGDIEAALRHSRIVVDALIGYGLRGTPQGQTAQLIDLCNRRAARVLALDLPSGLDATTGEARGAVVRPARTLTLALPKTGLAKGAGGELYLADIGIPPQLYQRLGLPVEPPFGDRYRVRLRPWRETI